MDNQSTARLEAILTRQLSWIAQADAKIAPILAIDTAMIGLWSAIAPSFDNWTVPLTLSAIVTAGLLALSIWYLFLAAFPRTEGPHDSTVFFGSIASMTEADYVRRVLSTSSDDYNKDLAQQCHRNATIASTKYRYVRTATRHCIFALVSWLAFFHFVYAGA